jgi:hypothetical protein
MSDEITWKKKDVISRAQELAESKPLPIRLNKRGIHKHEF